MTEQDNAFSYDREQRDISVEPFRVRRAQIVERHGGSIRVEYNDGQGSVFTFTLQAADL